MPINKPKSEKNVGKQITKANQTRYYGNNKLYYVLGNYITKSFTMVEKSSTVNLVPLQPRNRGYGVQKIAHDESTDFK